MVEITQSDRIAAASTAVLVEMRELILAGKADHHAKPWALHRTAAIAAMRGERRAWLYVHEEFGTEIHTDRWGHDTGGTSDDYIGWTETALYAGPTPPASGKD